METVVAIIGMFIFGAISDHIIEKAVERDAQREAVEIEQEFEKDVDVFKKAEEGAETNEKI